MVVWRGSDFEAAAADDDADGFSFERVAPRAGRTGRVIMTTWLILLIAFGLWLIVAPILAMVWARSQGDEIQNLRSELNNLRELVHRRFGESASKTPEPPLPLSEPTPEPKPAQRQEPEAPEPAPSPPPPPQSPAAGKEY